MHVAGDARQAIVGEAGHTNSKMFSKEGRPPYLQDDDFFDKFKPEVALQATSGADKGSAEGKHPQGKQGGTEDECEEEHVGEDGGGEV